MEWQRLRDGVLHALEPAVLVLHGDIVIWNVTIVILKDLLQAPATRGLKTVHWSACLQ